jgi:hypothetical protein
VSEISCVDKEIQIQYNTTKSLVTTIPASLSRTQNSGIKNTHMFSLAVARKRVIGVGQNKMAKKQGLARNRTGVAGRH